MERINKGGHDESIADERQSKKRSGQGIGHSLALDVHGAARDEDDSDER